MLTELSASGELVGGEALAAPSQARLYRWDAGQPVATDGPYSETKEHLAGFFLIDVASQERAEEVVRASPGRARPSSCAALDRRRRLTGPRLRRPATSTGRGDRGTHVGAAITSTGGQDRCFSRNASVRRIEVSHCGEVRVCRPPW